MKQLLLALAIAFFIAFGTASDAHAGACARMGLDGVVVTHPADTLPADGGVLVAWEMARDGNGSGLGSGDPTAHADWRFRVKKKSLTPTVKTLAPGLSVYLAPRGVKKGKLQLVDGSGKKLGNFTVGAASKLALAAPKPTGATTISIPSYRSANITQVDATLDAAPPSSAYGVIVYDAQSGDVLTWDTVTGVTDKSIHLYTSPGRCGSQPAGMQAPYQGQAIQLAWVDHFGRIGPKSASVTVAQGQAPTATPDGP